MTSTNARIAVVTGANQGIGYELVRQLAKLGHVVYLGARSEDKGKEAVAKLASEDKLDKVHFLLIDVTNNDSVKAAAKRVEQEQGRLDILINNAGIMIDSRVPNAASVDIDIVQKTYDTNLFGVIRTTVAFVPLLKRSNNPVIANLSSGLGSTSTQTIREENPFFEFQYPAYNSSKAALNSYTVTLAYDFKEARVNVVSPGYVKTSMNSGNGAVTAEESAAGILKHAVLLDKNGPTGQNLDFTDKIWPW